MANEKDNAKPRDRESGQKDAKPEHPKSKKGSVVSKGMTEKEIEEHRKHREDNCGLDRKHMKG